MNGSAKSNSTVNVDKHALIQSQWEEFVAQLNSGILIAGKYRIRRQISAGGMGVVFDAVNESSGGRVVLKVPFFDLVPESGPGMENPVHERIRQEMQAAIRAGAMHPGIVRMMDCVLLSGGTPALVMEFLEGDLLSDRIKAKGGKMELAEVLRLGRQMASALAAAHSAGVIHRDLKPSNVMIVRDPDVAGGERAKVFDFGIAKVSTRANHDKRLTQVGWFMGTRFYSAPEQQSDSASVDDKADVYSLGIVLYEMLGGVLPLQHPLKTARFVPAWLMQLLTRMTTASAELRPTMQQVVTAFEQGASERLRPEIGWGLFAALMLAIGIAGLISTWHPKNDPPPERVGSPPSFAGNPDGSVPGTGQDPGSLPGGADLGLSLALDDLPGTESELRDLGFERPLDLLDPDRHSGAPGKQPGGSTGSNSGAGHGPTHPPACPLVTARCLSIVGQNRNERLLSLVKNALTQDVQVRLCPEQRLTLHRNKSGILEIDAAREVPPRTRTIINSSLQSIVASGETPLPQKVTIRCK